MKVILFGATGMIGQAVLRECLLDPEVEAVLAIGRAPSGKSHPKLRELTPPDLFDLTAFEPQLLGYDVCLFCLGVSSVGMKEAAYHRITYELTLSVAETLCRIAPQMRFLYVSGGSTDGTEQGRIMWARVKGKTENALLRLPFRSAHMLRPAYIQPLHGIRARTRSYRILYAIFAPLYPLLKLLFGDYVTTTEILGRAMVRLAKLGGAAIYENRDLNVVGAAAPPLPAGRAMVG
jgi:uncharacterized protein YbjT (DUF2867 family)